MEKPLNINFSSGPCAKHSGWTVPVCELAGRSHRSSDGLAKIQDLIRLQRKILKIPDDYLLGIVSASTTGAMETLIWSLLGERGVDVLRQCLFSNRWADDIQQELKLKDVRFIEADFPSVADVRKIDFDRDVVFCWTSTTSGVSFSDQNWITQDRTGLTICDAASSAFIVDFDWSKLDALAFSWQKGLGGEAGFGSIVLSPRAIHRLETHKPNWPIPRIFRIADNKKVNYDLFNGYTINTPSMICIEDFYESLLWADKLGGIKALVKKVEANYNVAKKWINQQKIFRFLVDEKCRAHHIACLDIASVEYQAKSDVGKWNFLKKIVDICEKEKVGLDLLGHILTKPHIRVWMGPTIESQDLEKFFPWLEYAYNKTSIE